MTNEDTDSSCRLTTSLPADGSDRRDTGTDVGGTSYRPSAIARLLERAPAPWSVTGLGNVVDANELYVCTHVRNRAHHFIAAIPDMLAALQAAAPVCEQAERLLKRLENTP